MDTSVDLRVLLTSSEGVLAQVYSGLLGRGDLSVGTLVAITVGLSAWLVWKNREALGRFLRIYQDITEKIIVVDPHGFHMRRCMDLVQVARRYVAYGIYIRYDSGGGKTWANARSIMSLQTLGVRGPGKDGKPPVVEVKVSGIRPWNVMREVRQVLESAPQKYLSVHELYALAQKSGGQLVVKSPARAITPFRGRFRKLKERTFAWVSEVLYPKPEVKTDASATATIAENQQTHSPAPAPLNGGADEPKSRAEAPAAKTDAEVVRAMVEPHFAKLRENLLRAKKGHKKP